MVTNLALPKQSRMHILRLFRIIQGRMILRRNIKVERLFSVYSIWCILHVLGPVIQICIAINHWLRTLVLHSATMVWDWVLEPWLVVESLACVKTLCHLRSRINLWPMRVLAGVQVISHWHSRNTEVLIFGTRCDLHILTELLSARGTLWELLGV